MVLLFVIALAFIPTSGRQIRRTPGRGHLTGELARGLAFGARLCVLVFVLVV